MMMEKNRILVFASPMGLKFLYEKKKLGNGQLRGKKFYKIHKEERNL
jgi:hypothetical protein